MTQPNDLPDVDRIAAAFGYCHWCKGYASNVLIVAAADQGGGTRPPSVGACPKHRDLHGLTPIGSQ